MESDFVSITGTVLDVRGPFHDGSYEIDLEQEDGEVVTVSCDAEVYAEMIGSLPTIEAAALN